MALTRLRWVSCFFAVLLAFPSRILAFETPLSDTAIREAYFLGQRNNESTAKFLDKYYKHLPPPKSGPYISSVAILTPYAMVVMNTGKQIGHYSAQQAQIDHRDRQETVLCLVEIQLTDTYPAFIPDPASRTTPPGFVPRSYNFWTDFQVHFMDGENELRPFASSGHANYFCSDQGGCTLIGATIQFEFFAESFPTTEATVQIEPPEGESLELNFDLASVR